jgi:hypothetical protein
MAAKLVRGDRVKARTSRVVQVLGERESQGRIERILRLTAKGAATDFCRGEGPESDEV